MQLATGGVAVQPCSCHSYRALLADRWKMKTIMSELTAPLRRLATILGISVACLGVGGCSSSAIDSIPSWAGGEPTGTPERPAATAEYPPVNDRPPPRPAQLVTEEEQAKIERELAAARAAQAKRAQQVRKDRSDMLANSPSPAAPGSDNTAQQKNKPDNPSAN